MESGYKSYQSEYELKYVKWIGIEYDKEKLIAFIQHYQYLKDNHKDLFCSEELEIMNEILSTHNISNLEKLLNNDKDYSRWATIERWARIAAVEILLTQKYSTKTFTTISNLPVTDYKLVILRCKELVNTLTDITAEAEANTSKIPGAK
jgi:hypothetical protein